MLPFRNGELYRTLTFRELSLLPSFSVHIAFKSVLFRKYDVTEQMFVPSPLSCAEILSVNGIILRGGIFGRWSGLKIGTHMNGINTLQNGSSE